jgi:hypothetical protein
MCESANGCERPANAPDPPDNIPIEHTLSFDRAKKNW